MSANCPSPNCIENSYCKLIVFCSSISSPVEVEESYLSDLLGSSYETVPVGSQDNG